MAVAARPSRAKGGRRWGIAARLHGSRRPWGAKTSGSPYRTPKSWHRVRSGVAGDTNGWWATRAVRGPTLTRSSMPSRLPLALPTTWLGAHDNIGHRREVMMNQPTLDTLTKRLERLERENR